MKVYGISNININNTIQKYNNKKSENVSFCGEQTFSDRAKQLAGATALATIMMVGVGCSGNNDNRYHDVQVSCPELGFPNHIWKDTVKIEDGCGFSTNNYKYVMSNGVLWGYNKDSHQWYETDGFRTLNYLFGTFRDIAAKNDEIEGEVVLSNEDIEDVIDNPSKFTYRDGGYYRDAETNGNTLIVTEDQGDAIEYTYDADKMPNFIYGMKYLHMSPEEIAEDISEQISGYSDNDETITMIDAISDKKFLDVAKAYRKNNKEGLIEALCREFSMGSRPILDIIYRLGSEADLEPEQRDKLNKLIKKFYDEYVYDSFYDGRSVTSYKIPRKMDNIICGIEK